MRKLTHVFRWCLAAILLMVGTVVQAQITGVNTSASPATCAGSTHTVTLSGVFVPGCQVSFFLVNNTGTQIGPALLSSQTAGAQTYTMTIPQSIPQSLLPSPGGYAIRAISNCGGGETALGAAGPFPGAGGNTSAAFSLSAAYLASGTVSWDNSLTAAPFSTTGPAVACLGTVTSGNLTLRAETLNNAAVNDNWYWYKDGGSAPVASGIITNSTGEDAVYTIANPPTSAAGTYTLVLTNSIGTCTRTIGSIVVQISNGPSLVNANYQDLPSSICAGGTASVKITGAAGGSSPYSYGWSRTPGGAIPGATAVTLVLGPGAGLGGTDIPGTYAYKASVTDADGCTATTAQGQQLLINPGVGVLTATQSAAPANTVCTGDAITLTLASSLAPNFPQAGTTFGWTGPAGFVQTVQNPTFTATSTNQNGGYTVTAGTGSCTASASLSISNIRTQPTAVITTAPLTVCSGSPISLNGTGGVPGEKYEWQMMGNQDGIFGGLPYNPLNQIGAAGPVFTFAGGTTFTPGFPPTFAFIDGQLNLIPFFTTLPNGTLVSGSQTSNLNLSSLPDMSSLPIALPNVTANNWAFTLRVDNGRCNSVSPVFAVTVAERPDAAIIPYGSLCSGNTLTLLATAETSGLGLSDAQATWSWAGPNGFTNTNQSPNIANVTTAATGTYSVTVRNATYSSCTSSATNTVLIIATPTASISGPASACQGSSIFLTASSGGVTPVAYFWEEFKAGAWAVAGVPPTDQMTYNPTAASVGTTRYRVVIDNTVNATNAPTTCRSISPEVTFTVNATPLTGLAPAAVGYQGPGYFTEDAVVCQGSPISLGVYPYRDPNVGGTGAISAGDTPLAVKDPNTNPYSAGTTFSWAGPNGFTSGQRTPGIASAVNANGGVYSVTIANGSCTASATLMITIKARPTAVIANPTPVSACLGSTVTLSGSGGVAGEVYFWEEFNGGTGLFGVPGVAPANNATFNPTTLTLGTTRYRLVVDNPNVPVCRSISAEVAVSVYDIPVITSAVAVAPAQLTGTVYNLCSGTSLGLDVSVNSLNDGGTRQYSWNTDAATAFTSSTRNPNVNSAAVLGNTGTYTVTVRNSLYTVCSATSTVRVNVKPTPTAVISGPSIVNVCQFSALTLNGTGGVAGESYNWEEFSGGAWVPAGIIPNTSSSYSPTTQTVGSTKYRLVVDNVGNPPTCRSISAEVTVNVAGQPVLTAAGATATTTAPGIGGATGRFQCSGNTLTVNVGVVTPPAANTWSYAWTGPNGYTSAQKNPLVQTSSKTTDSGVYAVVVSNPASPVCSVSSKVDVTVIQTPVITDIAGPQTVCAGQSVTLVVLATNANSYAWSTPTAPFPASLSGSTVTFVTTGAMVAPSPATYTAIATNNFFAPNGATVISCPSAPSTTTVTVSPNPNNLSLTLDGPDSKILPVAANGYDANTYFLCDGVLLKFTLVTNAAAQKHTWAGPNGFSSTQKSPTVSTSASAVMSGIYTVTSYGSNTNCQDISTISVSVIARPTNLQAGSAGTPYCAGQTISLTAAADNANAFAWTGPNGYTASGASVTRNTSNPGINESGTYTVTYTNTLNAPNGVFILTCPNLGVPSTRNVTVQVRAVPVFASNAGYQPQGGAPATRSGAVAQGTTTFLTDNVATGLSGWNFYQCASNALTLNGTSTIGAQGQSYSWSGPNGFSSTFSQPLVNVNSTSTLSGVYVVTVVNTALSSCSITSSVNVNVINRPTSITASNTGPYCAGQQISLSASAVDGNSYSWYFPGSTVGGAADRTGSTTTRNTSSTPSATPAEAGTYTVLVTNSTVSPITGSPILTCPAVSEPLSTATTSVTIRQNPTFNNNPWAANGITALANGGLAVGTRQGVVVSNGVRGDNTTTGFAASGWNFYLCEGSALALDGTASIAAGSFTYSWSGPNGFSSNLSAPIVNVAATPLMSGVYVLTIANTSAPFCSTTSSVNVLILGKPVASAVSPNQSVCVGSPVTLSAVTTNATDISWTTNAGGYPTPTGNPSTFTTTTAMLGGTGPSSYSSYTATYTLGLLNKYNSPINGQPIAQCTSSSAATTNITVNPTPSQTFAAAVVVQDQAGNSTSPFSRCEGARLDLDIAGTPPADFVYSWSGPNSFSSTTTTNTLNPLVLANDGVYNVKATNQYGCSNTASFSVIVRPRPIASASASPGVLCAGSALTLSASSTVAGATYAWDGSNFPGTVTPSQLADPTIVLNPTITSGDGKYIFSVTVAKAGCSSSATTSAYIQAVPKIQAPIVDGSTVCIDGKVKVQANATAATRSFVSSWVWSGPGGFTANTQDIELTQANLPGIYTVYANTSAGCQGSNTVAIAPTLITGITENDLAVSVNGITITNGGTAYVPAGTAIQLALNALNGESIAGFALTNCNGNQGPNIDFFGPLGYQAFPNNFVGPLYQVVPENGCGFYSGSLTPIAGGNTYGPWKVVFTKTCGGTITFEFNIRRPVDASITAIAAPSTVNAGGSVALGSTVSGGTASAYGWAGPGGFSSNQQNPSFTAGAANTGVYTVSATINGGGVITATVAVNVVTPAPPGVADLMLIKDSKYRTMRSGSKTYITIVVKNNGPNAASGVTVSDVLPAGMTYTTPSNLSDSVPDDGLEHNGGSYGSFSVSGGTVSANFGSIASGATKEIKFYVTVTGSVGVTLLNTGSITSSANPDPNSGNNSDEVSILIVPGSSSRVAAGESTDGAIVVKSYPNPATDKVTIELTLDEPSKAELRMTDFSGRTVGEWKLNEETTHHTAEISMKEFKAGLYLLNAEAGTKRAVKKIVKAEN